MAAEYLSEASVAEFFDTSRTTIRRWVERGVLPKPDVIGGVKRWNVDALRRAVRGSLEAAPPSSARSADPDECMKRLLDGGQDRKTKARGRRR